MVTKQLSRLRDDKASGPDELVPRFLNEIREGIVQPLTLLFKKVVEETEVPEDWKQANVTPIFKSGSKSKTSNYRPVSLTIARYVRFLRLL